MPGVRLILLAGLAAMVAVVARGGVARDQFSPPGGERESSSPPPGPIPSPAGAPFLTMVVRSGYHPTQLGHRIAGPAATVRRAPQTLQENVPVGILRSTYRVTLELGHECEALARAQRDKGVRRAYLGAFPGQYPDCLLSGEFQTGADAVV